MPLCSIDRLARALRLYCADNNCKDVNYMRRHYLDNIRRLTVALVVIYHVIFIYNTVIPPYRLIGPFSETQVQDTVLYILYPWFMILLFIIAGISSRCYLETHSIRDFVHTRTHKLLVPSTIGLLLFGWLQGRLNMTLAGGFDGIPERCRVSPYSRLRSHRERKIIDRKYTEINFYLKGWMSSFTANTITVFRFPFPKGRSSAV